MNSVSLDSGVQSLDHSQPGLWVVWLFCVVTVVLSVSLLLLLPGIGGPLLVVFIPAGTAVTLISLTAGKSQVRARLFS